MYVSRLSVENIRGFHGARNVDLDLTRPDGSYAGWTVLAGPNGSGKSTLLRAIALALGEAPGGGLSSWLRTGAAEGGVRAGDHRWWLTRTEDGVTEQRSSGDRGLCASYGPHREDIGEITGWLTEQHLLRLERRPGAVGLLEGITALLDDGLLPDEHRVARVDSDGLWVAQGGAEFPLGGLGDGARAVVTLVLGLVRHAQQVDVEAELVVNGEVPTVPVSGVVLIDEAEAHLHLGWQQRLGEWLVAHFPNVQFIVSTHSPYICQAADPGGLIRLAGPQEQAPPRILDDDLHQRIVYGSGDDAALSELFGLGSPYSPQAEAERRLLIALERKLYAGQASRSEVAEYQELGAKLNSSLSARVDEVRARQGGGR